MYFDEQNNAGEKKFAFESVLDVYDGPGGTVILVLYCSQ